MNFSGELYKMNGAGNDFVLAFEPSFPENYSGSMLARRLCDRSIIGADGLVVIRSLSEYYKIMVYNSDGSQVQLCLNASRCAIYLLLMITGNKRISIKTEVGVMSGFAEKENIKLFFEPWFKNCENKPIKIRSIGEDALFFLLADPHVVLINSPLIDYRKDFLKIAQEVRSDTSIFPSGSNFHLIDQLSANEFKIRSFEKGIEKESVACGSGCLAAFIVLNQTEISSFETSLGDKIKITASERLWSLEGPVKYEYSFMQADIKNYKNS